MRDSHGKIVRWFGTSTDISAQIAAEDTLRERADLLDLASEAVMVRDASGVLQFWNVGAETLYGWKREEVIGKNVHEILRTAYPVAAREIDSRLIATGRWDGNLIQYTKDGHEITVASRQAIKAGTTYDGGSILEINRDITSQLQAEEALRKTERLAAMGRVAGIIAHEINNPLEAITNAFFLLRDHTSLNDEARYYARLAEEELLRVAHITRQTLSFYRESTQAVDVSISTVLDDVLELQSRRLRLNNITLDKEYNSDGAILGFPAELKQVFLNLIGNAVQAMPEGGRLKVRVFESTNRNDRDKRKGVRVSILDNGSGIKPEDAKRLFEPFFTTKSAKGTGLGLWISKGIVQKYDGYIKCRSLRQNGRYITCFSVFLPASNAVKPEEKGKAQEAIGSR
jgi:PAS domain S-box-containing protein